MPHDIDTHVGQEIRRRRHSKNLTLQRLALPVDVRFQQLQKYESGKNRVSASRLWLIARVLECGVADFFLVEAENDRA